MATSSEIIGRRRLSVHRPGASVQLREWRPVAFRRGLVIKNNEFMYVINVSVLLHTHLIEFVVLIRRGAGEPV